MEELQKRKMIIRIGRNTLSFTVPDPTNKERPFIHEPFIVKAGISMAANMREALKIPLPADANGLQVQVLLDSPSMLVPVGQFEEGEVSELYNHAFTASKEPRNVHFNVLPDLKAVCLFAINKDLQNVISDRFGNVQYIQAVTPVWRYLHQRSFTGRRNKLYGYFHAGRLDMFSFQQNRFKFCNAFEATQSHDALYFLLYVWKQLRLDTIHDELFLVGDIPEQAWLMQEIKQYVQNTYVINPAAEFGQTIVTKAKGMPFDLITLLIKGR